VLYNMAIPFFFVILYVVLSFVLTIREVIKYHYTSTLGAVHGAETPGGPHPAHTTHTGPAQGVSSVCSMYSMVLFIV
jgi:hypothetical protein